MAIVNLSYLQTLFEACEVSFAARAACQIGGVYVRIRDKAELATVDPSARKRSVENQI